MGAIFGKTKKTAPSRITEQDKAVLVNILLVFVRSRSRYSVHYSHLYLNHIYAAIETTTRQIETVSETNCPVFGERSTIGEKMSGLGTQRVCDSIAYYSI